MFISKETTSAMKLIIITLFIFFVTSVNELFFISWGGGGVDPQTCTHVLRRIKKKKIASFL